jgi:hypothetical protein
MKQNEYIKLRKQRTIACKQYARRYLQKHPCVDCGETDIRVLDFDHKIKRKRLISEGIHRGWPIRKLGNEISLCEIRCKNCHAIKHLSLVENCWRNPDYQPPRIS